MQDCGTRAVNRALARLSSGPAELWPRLRTGPGCALAPAALWPRLRTAAVRPCPGQLTRARCLRKAQTATATTTMTATATARPTPTRSSMTLYAEPAR